MAGKLVMRNVLNHDSSDSLIVSIQGKEWEFKCCWKILLHSELSQINLTIDKKNWGWMDENTDENNEN